MPPTVALLLSAAVAAAATPNVVLLMVDSMDGRVVGTGSVAQFVETPALDGLSQAGVTFENTRGLRRPRDGALDDPRRAPEGARGTRAAAPQVHAEPAVRPRPRGHAHGPAAGPDARVRQRARPRRGAL